MSKNERKPTRFEGIHQRESRVKRHNGKPDVCFEIDYRDPLTGKRIRKRIGWRSEGVTAEYAKGIRARLLHEGKVKEASGGLISPAKPMITLRQAFEIYKTKWLVPQGSRTKEDESIFKNRLQSIVDKPLNTITPLVLDTLMAELTRQGLASQSVKHALALVRRVMRKMVVWGEYSGALPFEQIRLPKVNNQRQRYLTPDEAHALLRELGKNSQRMWLMSLISLHCGLRFSEVARIRRSDISFALGTIHIRDPKEGRDRMVIMTPHVESALKGLPAGRNADLLFPSSTGDVMKEISSSFDRAVNKLGLNEGITDRRQKVVFHTLRHTFASWLAKSGNGQTVIADMLGHSSLEMSRRYTHLMPDTKKQAAISIAEFYDHANSSK